VPVSIQRLMQDAADAEAQVRATPPPIPAGLATIATSGAASDLTGTVPATKGGSLVLLQTYAPANVLTVDVTSVITGTYDEYVIDFLNLLPATNAVALNFTLSTDNGSTWLSANYSYAHSIVVQPGSAVTSGGSSSAATIQPVASALATSPLIGTSGSIKLFDPRNTSFGKHMMYDLINQASTDSLLRKISGFGANSTLSAVTALRFQFSSGNILSGSVRVFGVAKS